MDNIMAERHVSKDAFRPGLFCAEALQDITDTLRKVKVLRIRNAIDQERPIHIASTGKFIPSKRAENNDGTVGRGHARKGVLEFEPECPSI